MIETERLILSEAETKDKAFFFSLLNSPHWIEHIGDRGISTEQDAQVYIESSLRKSYKEKGYGLYLMSLKDSKEPIGICGFVKRDYLDAVDIGFAILPQYEGQGFTYEAAKATLVYGKTQLGFGKVFGITTQQNAASQHLLKKLGLSYVNTITEDGTNKRFLLFST